MAKFTCDYNCKHYFGFRTFEADSIEDATNKVSEVLQKSHIGSWDGDKKVDAECNHKCKLRFKISPKANLFEQRKVQAPDINEL